MGFFVFLLGGKKTTKTKRQEYCSFCLFCFVRFVVVVLWFWTAATTIWRRKLKQKLFQLCDPPSQLLVLFCCWLFSSQSTHKTQHNKRNTTQHNKRNTNTTKIQKTDHFVWQDVKWWPRKKTKLGCVCVLCFWCFVWLCFFFFRGRQRVRSFSCGFMGLGCAFVVFCGQTQVCFVDKLKCVCGRFWGGRKNIQKWFCVFVFVFLASFDNKKKATKTRMRVCWRWEAKVRTFLSKQSKCFFTQ